MTDAGAFGLAEAEYFELAEFILAPGDGDDFSGADIEADDDRILVLRGHWGCGLSC